MGYCGPHKEFSSKQLCQNILNLWGSLVHHPEGQSDLKRPPRSPPTHPGRGGRLFEPRGHDPGKPQGVNPVTHGRVSLVSAWPSCCCQEVQRMFCPRVEE
jgi:hypothetical protein